MTKKPQIFEFKGQEEGPKLLVFGAIHGNEPCGPEGINRALDLIVHEKIFIKRGSIMFVPVCNPLAFEKNVRFVDTNLNRHFFPKDNPQNNEDHLHNILCPLLEDCDVLLDLHSYTTQGEAFISLSNLSKVPDEIELAKALDIPRIIVGWSDIVRENEDVIDKTQAQGTTEYARLHGAKAMTLECGNHTHPRAGDVAFNAILKTFSYLGIAEIDKNLFITDLLGDEQYTIRLEAAVIKTRDGQFALPMKNMDFYEKGTVFARFDDGEEVAMPEDGFVVMPKEDVVLNGEWFYWGVKTNL